jgi:hypothetical protein
MRVGFRRFGIDVREEFFLAREASANRTGDCVSGEGKGGDEPREREQKNSPARA